MKLKTDWLSHLHGFRRRELAIIFSRSPKKLFNEGLELGAGDGFQSTLLSDYVVKLISTDFYPDILNRRNTESIEYLVCDAEKLSGRFERGQFDLIFSSNLLEHLPDLEATFAGMYHILKDEGITVHIMPSPFWKLCNAALYIPNIFVLVLEILTEGKGIGKVFEKAKEVKEREKGNNPKLDKTAHRSMLGILFPRPHGVSSSNFKEFFLFRKKRWKKEFEKANFELISIIKGPVFSGHGFGMDRIRRFLERLGFTSEYIYITVKKGKESPYKQYFISDLI